MQHQSDQSNK